MTEAINTGLAGQIACVRREIAIREKTYIARAAHGKMTRAKAVEEITLMKEVLATLTRLQAERTPIGIPQNDPGRGVM